MRTKTCFTVEIGGLPISLTQHSKDDFMVTYWRQVKDHLTYAEAARELGECIMHALACDSRLTCRGDGEASK